GLLPVGIGEALGTPVLVAATRVYSTTAQRSIAFSIIYALMNVGYFVAGYVFDFIRSLDLHVSIAGFQPTPHEQLFGVSLAIEILLFPAIYFLRRDPQRSEVRAAPALDRQLTDRQAISDRESARSGFWTGIGGTVQQSASETAALFRRLLGQSGFYRLLVFFLFIGFLKAIFLQMDYVFPKFGDRELGLHAPVGRLSAINSILIVLLVPIIGALTQRFSAYRMVVIGGVICAAGVFIMALPTGWFQPAVNSAPGQWLGHSYLGVNG